MELSSDTDQQKLKLLSSIDPDEVAQLLSDLLIDLLELQALAVLFWDQDLESYGDKLLFGARKKELLKFAEEYVDAGAEPKPGVAELDVDEYKSKLPRELDPAFTCRLELAGQLVACLILAGPKEDSEDKLAEVIGRFPLALALDHAWKFRELERENARLRSQYEGMEQAINSMEDQTRKIVQEVTAKDSMRTKIVERDRLVFSISNAVRSSVNVQTVLTTAVEQIGATFGASRCLVLRSVESAEQLAVFEYTRPDVESVKDLFLSEIGLRFAAKAMLRSQPHQVDSIDNAGYDAEFLRAIQFRFGFVIPFVLRERILAVLLLQSIKDDHGWSIDDMSLIWYLGDQLSVAIENAELHQEREQQAITDSLTGVANRRSFNEAFEREFERARRYNEQLSLVIIDLDLLKKINDTYGHATGDEAIKAIGKVLRQSSRTSDFAARYGGEEFCVLLPRTDLEEAEQLAERLRRFINEIEVEGPGKISASLGVGSYPVHANDCEELFSRTDEALYAAKQAGRNRVCTAQVSAKKNTEEKAPQTETNGDDKQTPSSAQDSESSTLRT